MHLKFYVRWNDGWCKGVGCRRLTSWFLPRTILNPCRTPNTRSATLNDQRLWISQAGRRKHGVNRIDMCIDFWELSRTGVAYASMQECVAFFERRRLFPFDRNICTNPYIYLTLTSSRPMGGRPRRIFWAQCLMTYKMSGFRCEVTRAHFNFNIISLCWPFRASDNIIEPDEAICGTELFGAAHNYHASSGCIWITPFYLCVLAYTEAFNWNRIPMWPSRMQSKGWRVENKKQHGIQIAIAVPICMLHTFIRVMKRNK